MGLTDKQIRDHAINDVGSWGDKDVSGTYAGPLTIAGEKVDVDAQPGFGDPEMGDLMPDPETAGDLYESAIRTPRFRA